MITFENVTQDLPRRHGRRRRPEIEVPTGTLTVFVGPSGCGKTTSMRMINRMIEPSSGTITVDGRDIAGVDPVKLRLGIGYVIQSGGLMPHQRVIDNVATVPVLKGQSRRAARKAAYGVLERVGLDPKLGDRYPGAALRRSAATRRCGPGAGRRSADPADGRAVLGGRPGGPRRAAGRNPAAARRIAQDHRVRHARHRRGDQARRPGRGVRPRRRAAAVRRPGAAAVATRPTSSSPGFIGADRGYRGLQFRRPTGCRCTTSTTVTEADIDGLRTAPGELAAGTSATTARRSAGSTPKASSCTGGEFAVRQHDRGRIAVPAGRHDAAGTGLGAVLAGGARGGRRRRRAGDRRGVKAVDVLDALGSGGAAQD